MLSHSESTKTQVAGYKHMKNISGLFGWYQTGTDFSFSNNLANLGSFAKASVPV